MCRDNPAVPEDDIVRTALREQWHLAPSEITELPRAVMSRGWEVTAGPDRYVARLAETAARLPVEAGLAAAVHLRGVRIEAGEPVRTLSGALTVETPHGALAVLRRYPAGTWTVPTRSTSSGGANGWAPCTGPWRASGIPG